MTDTRTPIMRKMGELQHAFNRVRLRHINGRPVDEQQAAFNLFVIRSIELARELGFAFPCTISLSESNLFKMIEMANANHHGDMLLEQCADGSIIVTQPPRPADPKEIQG